MRFSVFYCDDDLGKGVEWLSKLASKHEVISWQVITVGSWPAPRHWIVAQYKVGTFQVE